MFSFVESCSGIRGDGEGRSIKVSLCWIGSESYRGVGVGF